jgi:acyl carrier protein
MMGGPSVEDIVAWLVARVAEILEVPIDEIDVDGPIMNLALSSVEAVSLSGELEEYVGTNLSPTLIYQHASLSSLAAHLGGA